MKTIHNPWNILNHKKYEIEQIPSWAIVRAMRMREQKVRKVAGIIWGVGLLLAVQALALLEWAR